MQIQITRNFFVGGTLVSASDEIVTVNDDLGRVLVQQGKARQIMPATWLPIEISEDRRTLSVPANTQVKFDGGELVLGEETVVGTLPALAVGLISNADGNILQEGLGDGKLYVPADGIAATCRKYVALLTQSGYVAPVATVLENSLGFTPTYAYDDLGKYFCEAAAGSFPAERTVVIIGPAAESWENSAFTHVARTSTSQIAIVTGVISVGASDEQLLETYFEIRVYDSVPTPPALPG